MRYDVLGRRKELLVQMREGRGLHVSLSGRLVQRGLHRRKQLRDRLPGRQLQRVVLRRHRSVQSDQLAEVIYIQPTFGL